MRAVRPREKHQGQGAREEARQAKRAGVVVPVKLLLALLLLVASFPVKIAAASQLPPTWSRKRRFISAFSETTTTTSSSSLSLPPPARLRQLFENVMSSSSLSSRTTPILLPCCYDGLTARLIARAGFEATFMTGFGVSAARGHPDTQLVSYDEMLQSANMVSEGLMSAALEMKSTSPIPCIADGDTGYGNAVNVKRTVWGYARAGMAGVMIEDQVAPKRCGHVSGKSVVSRDEAMARVQAACDARDEYEALYGPGTGPLIMARTDAIKTHSFEEALERCRAFRHEASADMTFLEAPTSVEQMQTYCQSVEGPKLANMLEYGSTPILSPSQLYDMGYTMAAYPLTLLSSSIRSMQQAIHAIQKGESTTEYIMTFEETKDVVGFTHYSNEEARYATNNGSDESKTK